VIADIPGLFSDIVDGKPAIPPELSWATERETEFFLQWYGRPTKIIGGKTHKWDGAWVECEEKKDIGYTDARICSAVVDAFLDDTTKQLADGYYWMVGEFGDNPYGFRIPMLIPADFFKVNYDKPLTYDGFREYFIMQPNVFGVVLYNAGRWAHVDGHTVGLDFKYDEKAPVPEVRADTKEKAAGK